MRSRIALILLFLLLFPLFFSFFPQWHWWGIDTAKSFPVWLRVALASLFILSLAPKISNQLGRWIASISNSADKWKSYLIYWFLCAVLFSLFILFSEKNYLLGDGYNVIGNIASGGSFSPTEPLDYLWHHWIFSLTSGGENGAIFSYRISSYLAGLIFLTALFFYLREKGRLLVGLTMAFCFGASQFFFGYAESYAFSFVFSFLYIMSARNDLQSGRLSIPTTVWLILAIGFHLMSAVLAPSFIYLCFMRVNSRSTRIAILSGLTVLGIAGILFVGRHMSLKQIYVPLWPTDYSPYHLFSIAHLKDMINILWLNFPLVLLVPIIWKSSFSGRKQFFLWAVVPALLFTVIVDPKIGAFRDWDILAIASAPILGMLLTLIESDRAPAGFNINALAIPFLIFGFFHTGGFVWQNSRNEENYPLFKEMVQEDPHYSKEYYLAYRNRPWGLIARERYNDIDEAIRAWTVRYQAEREDYLNVTNLAGYLLERGDTSSAASLLKKEWRSSIDYPEAVAVTVSLLVAARDYNTIENIYDSLVTLGRNDAESMYQLGAIKRVLGDMDSCVYYFDQAFRINPSPPIDQAFKFYSLAFARGYYRVAGEGLTRIMPALNENGRAAAQKILDSLRTIQTTR